MCNIILNLVCAFYLGNQEGIRIKNVNIRGQLCWQALYTNLMGSCYMLFLSHEATTCSHNDHVHLRWVVSSLDYPNYNIACNFILFVA